MGIICAILKSSGGFLYSWHGSPLPLQKRQWLHLTTPKLKTSIKEANKQNILYISLASGSEIQEELESRILFFHDTGRCLFRVIWQMGWFGRWDLYHDWWLAVGSLWVIRIHTCQDTQVQVARSLLAQPSTSWNAIPYFPLDKWVPGDSVVKNLSTRIGFNPWVGKISWRRKWQATPVFLPGKSHGQGSLASYSL